MGCLHFSGGFNLHQYCADLCAGYYPSHKVGRLRQSQSELGKSDHLSGELLRSGVALAGLHVLGSREFEQNFFQHHPIQNSPLQKRDVWN